ncbi:hypothetical protein CAPTEDRAFT_214437 [Capitella teleta]|uniref:Uncharacterized protein n=1 Tax=Capitella teleta TaxID=283909 RepID=R7UYH5_CAPTE|nr:hypothetical protein CAPTEDRAFT_214437 [Capitella teleta]|eukprot:ELU08987.1 hypothetical protein CAPTEDRAFT_214437 [Capitella teleta]
MATNRGTEEETCNKRMANDIHTCPIMNDSTSSHTPHDLPSMETDAKDKARIHVANLLQRPDQLEKVEQIRKRNSRKRASVEAQLKTAVQSQLDGVRTGLSQLYNAFRDIRDIKSSLGEVDITYASINTLGEKLSPVREENSRHSQLAAAVENLKHIFTVPETVKKCDDFICDGKLLHAHKCLCDLEGSRDDLLLELHKQQSPSPTDKAVCGISHTEAYNFSDFVLWLILQRTIMTVRREPTMIVTVLRIIEREERTDALMLKRFDQTEFLPPGRPKRWRSKAFQVMEEAVLTRIEGNQTEDRDTNKMWLVRHLEVTRQLVLEDLRVARTLCELSFPPYYDIGNKYVAMYHNGISQHDWYREVSPESDDKGYYLTSLPVILMQMIEQNLTVAATISEELVKTALALMMDEMDFFLRTYKAELLSYKVKHTQDRSQPQFYLHYVIANINNCQTFGTLVEQIRETHFGDERSSDSNRFTLLSEAFNTFAYEATDYLIEEVMTDLDQQLVDLITRKWLLTSVCVDTICITIEDYCQDFVHLKDKFYEILLKKTQHRVANEYFKSLFAKKITFKNYDERGPAADKMCREAEQLTQIFGKLVPKSQEDSPFLAISPLSEMIRLRDTSMMSLEISGLVNTYPDVRMEHLINMLMIRGDVNRGEAKQIVEDCLGHDHDLKPKSKKTIFSMLNLR